MYTRPLMGSITMVIALAVIGCGGSRSAAETVHQERADFTGAAQVEVRNAQGQVILTGTFVVGGDEDDMERKATLATTGVDADAVGEAEVEVTGTGNGRRQEVEFSVSNVEPRAALTFVIDGRAFATIVADDRGRAEIERVVPLPGQ